MLGDMMGQQRNWHYEWIIRTVERMEELKQRGEHDVMLHIEEFQRILRELLAMHQRSDRLEDVLCSYARYAFPVNQRIELPAMFGGDTNTPTMMGATMVGHPVPGLSKPEHCHIFRSSGYGYDVCNDCGMSDVYYNWAHSKPKPSEDDLPF